MRALSIGTVTFDKKQYILDDYAPLNVSAISERTISGGVVIWEQINKDSAKNITLSSGEDYFISETNLKDLQTLIDNSLGQTYDLVIEETDRDCETPQTTTIQVRFRHEDGALSHEPLWEGSKYHKITLNLARI